MLKYREKVKSVSKNKWIRILQYVEIFAVGFSLALGIWVFIQYRAWS